MDAIDRLLHPGTVLLDSSRPDQENRRTLLFESPVRILRADRLEEVPEVLAALDSAVGEGLHAAGFVAYEAGYAFERIAPLKEDGGPLVWFGLYEAPRELAPADLAAVLETAASLPADVGDPAFALDFPDYAERIGRIKALIREGDVYQINFTAPVAFQWTGHPLALYARLRRRQRVNYGALLSTGDRYVLSRSPELFFRRDGRRVWTRPMKGTVGRGRTLGEDEARAAWLREDAKSRAENLMIVDLLRNDLSVCCEPGSVRVPRLFETESYETVIQMTSTVEGRLRPDVGYAALFRALFPCGSITGAPKIRAMQAIHELETAPRGVYCGAIGHVAPGEQAVFSVAIRTVVLGGDRGTMGTGGGIVWDSEAEAEYRECLLKARFLTMPAPPREPFRLIETMRWEDGVALLSYHADRLEASAAYFRFAFDRAAFIRRVEEAGRALPAGEPHRLRATLGEEGDLEVSTTPLAAEMERPLRVGWAGARVDPSDPFFFHKTTRRALYEDAYADALSAGLDEVLFLNARGEVTESARGNVFVRRGGALLTPPVESGLLAGVYRRHVLETEPGAREAVLHPEDVAEAEAVYLCNAVRGMRRVETVGRPGGSAAPELKVAGGSR